MSEKRPSRRELAEYRNWKTNRLVPSDLSYSEYRQAKSEWNSLVEKYGSWTLVWENEPQQAERLENLLA